MTERLSVICSHIPKGRLFADVGCDHGYCTRYVLDNGLCERAYISDVSRESLKKAETLLSKEMAEGKCLSFCTDGMNGFPEVPDVLLIAGMGGEEIIKILTEGTIPEHFVLQPMKNAEKVRAFLIERGAKIVADYTFYDGKFYDLIVGEKTGEEHYSPWEIAFGRDNLKNPSEAFLKKIRKEEKNLRKRLANPALSQPSREKLRERLYELEEITDAVDSDL